MKAGFIHDLSKKKYTDAEWQGAIALAVNDLAHEKAMKYIPLALKLYSEKYNEHVADKFQELLEDFKKIVEEEAQI